MPRTKSNNANYAEYMERLVDAAINNNVDFNRIDSEMCYDHSMITHNEKLEMLQWAKNIQLAYNFKTSIYTGRKTSNEKGDLVLDGKITELKCVEKNKGTYFNTSVSYLDKFGIKNPAIAYEKIGYRSWLAKLIQPYGLKVTNKDAMSFVDPKTSSKIQKLPIYKKYIVPLDKKIRAIYVKKLYEYFISHPEDMKTFILDMMDKSTKGVPDQILIYNYFNNSMNLIQTNEIIANNTQNCILKCSGDYGLSWGNSIRAIISWQNGTGCNNFTIRVFI